jgi:hypothetical protein
MKFCRNPRCRKPLIGRRKDARACSNVCRSIADRAARRIQRAYEHPRCVVCSGPMDWSTNGFRTGTLNLRAVTCSRKCAYTRANWLREDRAA